MPHIEEVYTEKFVLPRATHIETSSFNHEGRLENRGDVNQAAHILKMVAETTVRRLVTTAHDFDTAGLEIVSYYLRLYAVEEILSKENKSETLTQLASELLTKVEDYKSRVESNDDDSQKDALLLLIHDQQNAKIYVSNFAMSLYNGKLKQIKDGPWDINLRRGLWCCIDLFSCISHLWDDAGGNYKKRVKYCKLYLSKLAKGELDHDTPVINNIENYNDPEHEKQSDIQGTVPGFVNVQPDETSQAPEGIEEPESTPSQWDDRDIIKGDNQGVPSDDELNDMLKRLRAKEDSDDNDEEEIISSPKELYNKQIHDLSQKCEVSRSKSSENDVFNSDINVPTFVDSDEEEGIAYAGASESISKPYTQDELRDIMDKSSKIENIQRLAKYAISALNYDDLSTAEDELTKALNILKSIK